MSEYKLNDNAVISGSIVLPQRGAWHADLVVDTDEAPEGEVTLSIASGDDTVELTGYARRKGLWQLRATVRVVGGAGQLGTVIDPRYYTDTDVETVLGDLLRDAGETLSDTVSSDLRGVSLAKWTRKGGTAGAALDALARSLGLPWRVLLDGTVWLGEDSWDAIDLEADVLNERPAQGIMLIATDSFPAGLLPGKTFSDRHVTGVEHTIEASKTRATVYFEDAVPTDLAGIVKVLVAQAVEAHTWFRVFPGRVSEQDDDGTLQVELDDALYPGLTKVPVRTFVPGASVKIAEDARVHVLFEGGDPSKPCACLFDGSPSQLVELTITTRDGASLKLADGGDAEAKPGSDGVWRFADGDARVGRVGDRVKVKIPVGSVVIQVTGQAAGVLNTSEIECTGTIDEGAESVEA